MSMLETLKAEHMANADERWEDAIVRIKGMLGYRDPKVRSLTYRLLYADSGDRFNMFGGDGRSGTSGYYHLAVGQDPCTIFEETAQFVSHEILDDGDPGIGYHTHQIGHGMFVPCAEGDKGAKPYFHHSLELLLEKYPKAKYADIDAALKVLDWYDAYRAQCLENAHRLANLQLRQSFGPGKETVDMRALTDELVQMIEAEAEQTTR